MCYSAAIWRLNFLTMAEKVIRNLRSGSGNENESVLLLEVSEYSL